MACDGEIHETSPVPGIVYRDQNGIPHFNGYRAKGIDLDTLPFPAYEKLDGYPQAYKLPIFNYPTVPNTSCISSRGCPYACSYCDRSVFGSSFRYNSAEYLYEHLKYLNDRFHIRHINFYDDQFTFNRKRVEAFTRLMIDKPLGMTFNCAVRAEHIDLDLARMMKEAGCWMISLGVETGDEDLLAQHRKNPNLEMLAEKIRMIHKVRIRVKGLLMLGLPGETESSIQKSMDYVFSLPIDDINVSKFTPFPGTPLYEKAHELGTFDEDWEKMDCMHFLFVPKGMTGRTSGKTLYPVLPETLYAAQDAPRLSDHDLALSRQLEEVPDQSRRVSPVCPDRRSNCRTRKGAEGSGGIIGDLIIIGSVDLPGRLDQLFHYSI